MKVHKLTKWAEGQILIKAHDELCECALELRETQPKLGEMLWVMALTIGTEFNKLGSHDFGLRDLRELKRKPKASKRKKAR